MHLTPQAIPLPSLSKPCETQSLVLVGVQMIKELVVSLESALQMQTITQTVSHHKRGREGIIVYERVPLIHPTCEVGSL